MPEKQSCWEYMECGRQPGGKNAAELGTCPASTALVYNGINEGSCAGRYCWSVAGTYCNGDVQGTFAAKIKDCLKCPFLVKVAREQGEAFIFTM